MVRNFRNQKGRPPCPCRSCRKRAGPGEESRTSRAMNIISGRSNIRPIVAPTTSMTRLVLERAAAVLNSARSQRVTGSGTAWDRTSREIGSSWSDEDGNGNEVLIVGASPDDSHAGPRAEDRGPVFQLAGENNIVCSSRNHDRA